jgi:DNA invertase Pin-like site-specific DNA recombinase
MIRTNLRKIAISYLRFSTEEQKKGNSTQRQKRKFYTWCMENNLEPDETLSIMDEGLSGYRGEHLSERGALGVFLAAVKDGKFPNHVLVVENLDRLSRQEPYLSLKTLENIIEYGVDIHVIEIARDQGLKLTLRWENDKRAHDMVYDELYRAWNESVRKSGNGPGGKRQ